jgi:hypothetical protein
MIRGIHKNRKTKGNQVWEAKNLKTTKFMMVPDIPNVTGQRNGKPYTPGYCWYDYNADINQTFWLYITGFRCTVNYALSAGVYPLTDQWTALHHIWEGEIPCWRQT